MSGQVRIWQSFSCNNSSSYRLIARFSDATKAAAVAAELEALRGPQPELGALAETVGFEWNEWFPYGEEEDPTVAAENEVLAVYHSYCLGFPEEFTTWLRARGGEVEKQHAGSPQVSALFTASGAWIDELQEIFAQHDPKSDPRTPLKLPWASAPDWGQTSFFHDGETLGFSAPVVPADLPALKRWLAERGVTRPALRLCAYDDTAKFEAIARARCSGCGGSLRYVEPTRYGLDAEHLACATCGAMYELSHFRG